MLVESVWDRKPCPFCGYHKIFVIKEKDYNTNIHNPLEQARQAEVWFHCVCLKCKTQTREESSIKQAVEVWNMRVGE